MERDWNGLFDSIIKDINIDSVMQDDQDDEVDQWLLNRAIVGMNEAATYLGRHVMQCIEDDNSTPSGLAAYLTKVIELTEALSELLSDCDCEDCSWDDEDEA
jgi:hypothetical protein